MTALAAVSHGWSEPMWGIWPARRSRSILRGVAYNLLAVVLAKRRHQAEAINMLVLVSRSSPCSVLLW